MKWKPYQKKCSPLELDISEQEFTTIALLQKKSVPQQLCKSKSVYNNNCVSEEVFIAIKLCYRRSCTEISMFSKLRKYSSSDTLSQLPMNIHRNYERNLTRVFSVCSEMPSDSKLRFGIVVDKFSALTQLISSCVSWMFLAKFIELRMHLLIFDYSQLVVFIVCWSLAYHHK